MTIPLQPVDSEYVPYVDVRPAKWGYRVKLSVTCKQQGNLLFRRASRQAPTLFQKLSLTAKPVVLLDRIEAHGFPLAHRSAFIRFAETRPALIAALSFLLITGDFDIDLVNGVLTASGGNTSMEIDPDEVSRAFSDLARLIDDLPFKLQSTLPWQVVATGFGVTSFIAGLFVFTALPSALDASTEPSYRLLLWKILLIACVFGGHYLLCALLLRRHALSNYVIQAASAGWLFPAVLLGVQLGADLNHYGPSEKETYVLDNAQIVSSFLLDNHGNKSPRYTLESDKREPLLIFGTRVMSLPLSAGEYDSLTRNYGSSKGTYSVVAHKSFLGVVTRDSIERIQ